MCLGRGGSVDLVIIARKGITTHLILWPDDRRQNVSRQGIECTTHGIRRERLTCNFKADWLKESAFNSKRRL